MNSSHTSDSSARAHNHDSAAMRAWMGRSLMSFLVSVKFFVLIQVLTAVNLFFDIELVWGVVLVSVALAFAADVVVKMKNARKKRAV